MKSMLLSTNCWTTGKKLLRVCPADELCYQTSRFEKVPGERKIPDQVNLPPDTSLESQAEVQTTLTPPTLLFFFFFLFFSCQCPPPNSLFTYLIQQKFNFFGLTRHVGGVTLTQICGWFSCFASWFYFFPDPNLFTLLHSRFWNYATNVWASAVLLSGCLQWREGGHCLRFFYPFAPLEMWYLKKITLIYELPILSFIIVVTLALVHEDKWFHKQRTAVLVSSQHGTGLTVTSFGLVALPSLNLYFQTWLMVNRFLGLLIAAKLFHLNKHELHLHLKVISSLIVLPVIAVAVACYCGNNQIIEFAISLLSFLISHLKQMNCLAMMTNWNRTLEKYVCTHNHNHKLVISVRNYN